MHTIYVGAAPNRASQHGSGVVPCCCSQASNPESVPRARPVHQRKEGHRSRVGPAARAHGTRRKTQLCAPPTPSFVPRRSAQTALTLQQGPAQGDVVHTRLQVRDLVVCGARRPGPRDNAVCGEIMTIRRVTRSSESGARLAWFLRPPSRVSSPSRRLRRGVIGTLAPRLLALRHLPHAVPARDVPVARHRHQRDALEDGDEDAKL